MAAKFNKEFWSEVWAITPPTKKNDSFTNDKDMLKYWTFIKNRISEKHLKHVNDIIRKIHGH